MRGKFAVLNRKFDIADGKFRKTLGGGAKVARLDVHLGKAVKGGKQPPPSKGDPFGGDVPFVARGQEQQIADGAPPPPLWSFWPRTNIRSSGGGAQDLHVIVLGVSPHGVDIFDLMGTLVAQAFLVELHRGGKGLKGGRGAAK